MTGGPINRNGPIVLSSQPLPLESRRQLKHELSASPGYAEITHLRRLPVRQLLREIRGWRNRHLVLGLADIADEALLPILELTSSISGARPVSIFSPQSGLRSLKRRNPIVNAARIGWGSASGILATKACHRELSRLVQLPRQPAKLRSNPVVLHVNGNLWFGVKAGGSVGHVAGVVNALANRGFEVHVASVAHPALVVPKVPFHRLEPPATLSLPAELNHYCFHRLVTDKLRRLSGEVPVDLIYQRMSFANFAGVELSRALRIPLVIEYNGSEVWVAEHWGSGLRTAETASLAERVCVRHAHLVVTVSDVLRDDLIERHGLPAERVVMYPNCVDPEMFNPDALEPAARDVRARLGIPADACVVTFIGTFGQWHGTEVLAKAIRQLVNDDPAWLEQHRVRFLLVGDGLKMHAVRALVGGTDCAPFVTLTGLVPQDQAPAYLVASDILVSPHVANADGSRFFGSPTKLFEYMVVGRAILASDLDQIGHVLRNSLSTARLPDGEPSSENEMAVLAPPGDVDALIDGLRFLVERPGWRAQLGRNARTEALSHYTWKHHVDAIITRLDELGASPSGL